MYSLNGLELELTDRWILHRAGAIAEWIICQAQLNQISQVRERRNFYNLVMAEVKLAQITQVG